MKSFSIKFIDIMVGVILGLGFQWWPALTHNWQYIAFFFVYIDLIDYWIDYAPSLKKFPPKSEIDMMIDLAIMFGLFIYIYSTQQSFQHFMYAFAIFKTFDFIWLLRAKKDYKPTGIDGTFVDVWLKLNLVEIVGALLLVLISVNIVNPLIWMVIFVLFRVSTRLFASFRYKRIHFE